MTLRASVGLGLITFLAACASLSDLVTGPGACTLARVAEMPARIVGGAILVPVRIDGTAAEMMLDTGATSSLLSDEATPRLALPEDSGHRTLISGQGGVTLSRHARVRSLEVGGRTWSSLSLPVVRLVHNFKDAPLVAGILGGDRLSEFDVELDLPNGRMSLWHVAHCGGDFIRWNVPHYAIPLTRHYQNQMIAPVQINGRDATALVDWGASRTTVSGWFAAKLGVTPERLASDRLITSRGLDQNQLTTRIHRFDEVRIGPEILRGVAFLVADMHVEVGMTLGASFARRRRIWLSYATRQMFVAPPRKMEESPADSPTPRAAP